MKKFLGLESIKISFCKTYLSKGLESTKHGFFKDFLKDVDVIKYRFLRIMTMRPLNLTFCIFFQGPRGLQNWILA